MNNQQKEPDFKMFKEKAGTALRAELIDYVTNEEALKNIPHERFLDYAIVAVWDHGNGFTCRIHNQDLAALQMTREEVLSLAKQNTGIETKKTVSEKNNLTAPTQKHKSHHHRR